MENGPFLLYHGPLVNCLDGIQMINTSVKTDLIRDHDPSLLRHGKLVDCESPL